MMFNKGIELQKAAAMEKAVVDELRMLVRDFMSKNFTKRLLRFSEIYLK
jgi:hypothetical protein